MLYADVFTFFCPPVSYPQLFPLTIPATASIKMPCGVNTQTEGKLI
jgi:hypothetical protein